MSIKPNDIYIRERTAYGIPVSTLIGLFLCAAVFLILILGLKVDLNTALFISFPFAVVVGFFSGARWQDFLLNLFVHPSYIYNRGDAREEFCQRK